MSSFPRMHVSLYVADMSKTVAFYERFFNVKANKIKSDYAKFILEEPSLIISFVQNADKVGSNFGHLGFQVETQDKLKELMELANANNQVFLEEVGTNCCYATQDKFWAKDPDGYMWEVYYFHSDAEFNDPRYSDNSSEACCVATEKPMVNLADIKVINACEPNSGCC